MIKFSQICFSKTTFLLLFFDSFSEELAESANHLCVNALSLDPSLLYLTLNINDGLSVVSLVRCALTAKSTLSRLTIERLSKVCDLSLNLLHFLDDRHVLLDELLLRPTYLRHQVKFPALDIVLLVCGTHELLLHGKVAYMLLFERVNKKFNAHLAVL